MPNAPPAAGGGGAQEGQQGGTSTFSRIVQMIAIWMGMQLLMKQFMPAPASQTTTTVTGNDGQAVVVPANTGDIPPFAQRPAALDEGAVYSAEPLRVAPIWPEDSLLDIVVTVSESAAPKPLSGGAAAAADPVVMAETRFGLGNSSEKRAVDTTVRLPPAVQNNGTLWAHFFVGLTGSELDPFSAAYDPGRAYWFAYPLTQYIPRKKEVKTRHLLDDKVEEDEAAAKAAAEAAAVAASNAPSSGPVIASYYHPNTSLSFVPGGGVVAYAQSPPPVRQFIQLESTGARDGSGQNGWYYPVLFVNTFWQLQRHRMVLNETVATVPLHLDLNNLADWKFKTMASIEANARESARQAAFGTPLPGGSDGSEIEMIKDVLLDTNPYLLAVTGVVTVAHLLLEMLAFGSDIAHYRKKKDNVGISVRSILANVFMQTVIFLYLVDNSENTSWMILGSQGVGILIELWKITTVVDVRVRPRPGRLVPYAVVFEDKHRLTETEAKTQEYDEIAFRYMYMAAVPLLLAYAAYSLVYESHKSWYSYVIATLVGSVYAYGFLMMVPSLYINYRLKSVAHMPGKAMMYKFVNTFIDDLFAFTIKMPFLHRLATFRDDIIFFIYLYQRWAYRVDYTRVNEFGQGGDDEDEQAAAAAAKKDGGPAAQSKALPAAAAAAATGAEAAGGAAKKRKQ